MTNFYTDDLDLLRLTAQLQALAADFESAVEDIGQIKPSDVITFIRDLSTASRCMFSEVVTVVNLLFVMPATNATREMSFSALRRIKTYLRTTVSQKRLNHLMVLHAHKEFTDKLDLNVIANEFCAGNEYRMFKFGKFEGLKSTSESCGT